MRSLARRLTDATVASAAGTVVYRVSHDGAANNRWAMDCHPAILHDAAARASRRCGVRSSAVHDKGGRNETDSWSLIGLALVPAGCRSSRDSLRRVGAGAASTRTRMRTAWCEVHGGRGDGRPDLADERRHQSLLSNLHRRAGRGARRSSSAERIYRGGTLAEGGEFGRHRESAGRERRARSARGSAAARSTSTSPRSGGRFPARDQHTGLHVRATVA